MNDDELSVDQEFYFQWHITNRCNKRCRHCYHTEYSDASELDFPRLLKARQSISKFVHLMGKRGSLALTGGEPFLRRDDLFALLENFQEDGNFSHVDILSNGSLLTDDDCRRLKDLPVFRRIQVSLEGATAASNDRIRGKNAFKETLEAIDRLKAHGMTVAVMTTVTRLNMGEIRDLLRLMGNCGVDIFSFERFMPEGSGSQMRDYVLSAQELKNFEENMHEYSKIHDKPRILFYRPLMCLLDPESPTMGAMCSVGMNALTIMPDGTILPCRRLPIPIGNIQEDSLFELWMSSPLLWQARNPKSFKGKCGQCQHFTICRGCRSQAMAMTGDWLAEDPQCWM